MQTYDATNQGKLVNLEYGEGKSCNESLIIGVKGGIPQACGIHQRFHC